MTIPHTRYAHLVKIEKRQIRRMPMVPATANLSIPVSTGFQAQVEWTTQKPSSKASRRTKTTIQTKTPRAFLATGPMHRPMEKALQMVSYPHSDLAIPKSNAQQ